MSPCRRRRGAVRGWVEEMAKAGETSQSRAWPGPLRTVPVEGFIRVEHFVGFGAAHANALVL